jgi:hypothetical protein
MRSQMMKLNELIDQLKAAPPGSAAPAKAVSTPRGTSNADPTETKRLTEQLASVMSEKESISKENEALKTELSAFDESFFNEIEVVLCPLLGLFLWLIA